MLAACLIAANVYGQYPIYTTLPGHGTLSKQNDSIKLKYDTIRVVMLVCDTTSISWSDSVIVKGKLVSVGEPRKIYELKFAKWAYGYSVREYIGHFQSSTEGPYLVYRTEPFYKHIEYLDEDKKPLFNKIVWMAKELPAPPTNKTK